MTANTLTIRTAYAFNGRDRSYRARAYATDGSVKHSYAVALGDTSDDAIEDCLRYVRSMFVRDGIEPPLSVEHVGKVRGAFLDAWLF